MRDLTLFSKNVMAHFDNNYDNVKDFCNLALDASRGVFVKYSKDETQSILRNQIDNILGIDFKNARPMQRRQAWRENGKYVWSVIENVLLDRMTGGFDESNSKFMAYVEEANIADGDVNEFYVNDSSLLVVSKFAGNHHDIVRQKVEPGKAFQIDTSWYVLKIYNDFEVFQTGRADFAEMVDRMYRSIDQYRTAGLFHAFMGLDASLPTDLKYETPVTEATKDNIIDFIEGVKAISNKDVLLVGPRVAIQKLQSTINYNMFSDSMKDEKNKNGILGFWEGYEALALNRVNLPGTRDSIFSADDNKKIFVLPIDPDFKPIKRVNEGDVIYTEHGLDGNGNIDMTASADIRYQEGVGIVADDNYGVIIASN